MTAVAPAGRRITSVKDLAGFTPIPPDIDVDGLIRDTSNFKSITRIDAVSLVTDQDFEYVRDLIQTQVIDRGIPLVIENWHLRKDWPKWILNTRWLKENHGDAGKLYCCR